MLPSSSITVPAAGAGWELCFDPICNGRRSYVFPCDARGHVDMDSLGEHALQAYLYARAMRGRETSWPRVQVPMH